MKQDAAHKLQGVQGHDFFPVAVCRIAPAKANLALFEAKKPSVGDGDAVGVMSQIPNDVPWPGKWLLGVDDPVFIFQGPGKSIEGFAHLQRGYRSAELEPASTKCAAQQSEKFSSELGS